MYFFVEKVGKEEEENYAARMKKKATRPSQATIKSH